MTRRASSRAPVVKAIAEALGLEALAELEVTEVRRREVPDRLLRALVEPPPEITPRERETLVLLASGCSRQEIADELGIGYETVKRHLRNAYRKLGARNSIEAINAFLEHAA